jgi:cystathionine gamma-synthase
MRIETLAVHASGAADKATGAVTPPINLSTTFERDPDGGYAKGYSYQRKTNPNREGLEEALRSLEGGSAAAAFSSGSAAGSAVFQAMGPGAHVVAPLDAYYGLRAILDDCMRPWGVDVSFVDTCDLGAVAAAMRPTTRVVWVETPSNPLLRVADVRAIASLAHEVGAICVCDNTLATPVLMRPFDLGADLVVHATTKYVGGHSDAIGGAIVAREPSPLFDRIRHLQHILGAVPSPFECWLIVRGIKTLPYRMRAHCENAMRIAEFLATHPAVDAVRYPGLSSDPGHVLAARQMSGFGGLLSFEVAGGAREAIAVVSRCRLFTRATSFGGVESLIEHRASIEGPGSTVPANLLRVSAGLEHPDDLIEDLARSLSG